MNRPGVINADASTPVPLTPPTPTPSPTPLSSPDPNTIQTIAFGIAACFLGIISIYISYRQLQSMDLRRRRANRQASTNDIECPRRWQGGRNALFGPHVLDDESCILLSSDSYTMHRVVVTPKYRFYHEE